MNIAAIVVTYNRLNLLQRVIKSLRNQTVKLSSIIVVNNSSTDGTKEWLELQKDIIVINQENVGGSGGFYTGINYAYKHNYDWIWCMDDDVFPFDNCLEELLKQDRDNIGILCPQRIQNDEIFISEVLSFNLSNPFKPIIKKLSKNDIKNNNSCPIEGMVFEGPLIKKSVVDKIGLPNKDLFILYDDTDYSYRTVLSGLKVCYIPSAKLLKEYFVLNFTKEEYIKKNKWKIWYNVRNNSFFCRKYGKNCFYRYLAPWRLLLYQFCSISYNLMLNDKYTFRDFYSLFRAYYRGINFNLGKL